MKPMNELPLHHIFVYSKADDFCADMFPPNAGQIRRRFQNSDKFMESQVDNGQRLDREAMGCIYEFYAGADTLYLNLHDAYIAFKEKFVGFELEDAKREKEKRQREREEAAKSKKSKKGRKRSKKEEMSSDEEEDTEMDPQREKLNQIQFRMSIDDLRFCGFLKATNRKKEALMKMAELL